MIGVGLFFFAGLLPDPDEPYTPANWNTHTWMVCVGFETVILSIAFNGFQGSLSNSPLDISQIGLSILRIFVLVVMLTVFWLPHAFGIGNLNTPEETEQLLGTGSNGRSDTGYGTSQNRLKGVTSVRLGDAQTTTWLDYVVGFRKLFPFLW